MTGKKVQVLQTFNRHRWSIISISFVLIALGALIAFGFHISQRPSVFNYPTISVVRELGIEADRIRILLDNYEADAPPPAYSTNLHRMEQAFWHLEIMLTKPPLGNSHAAVKNNGDVFNASLKILKKTIAELNNTISRYAGLPGPRRFSDRVKVVQLCSRIVSETDAMEKKISNIVKYDRRQFRLTIIGMTVVSLVMVLVAGLSFWRFERDQARIQVLMKAANDELEAQVNRRTQMLSEANLQLTQEIDKHKKAQKALLKYEERLRRVTSELMQTQEKERRRIATEIHDRIGQSLSVAKIQLGAIQSALEDSSLKVSVNDVRQLISQSIKDTRSLTFELSPPVLYDLGLQAAIEWLAENVRSRNGPIVTVTGNPEDRKLNTARKVFMFQAVRELLFNVEKHANACKAHINIKNSPCSVDIIVADDGVGCDWSFAESQRGRSDPGFGIFSIREQLRYYGGRLDLESEPGEGVRATIHMPLKRTA